MSPIPFRSRDLFAVEGARLVRGADAGLRSAINSTHEHRARRERLSHRRYLAVLIATVTFTGCAITDPAEYLWVRLIVEDAWRIPDVIKVATPSQPIDIQVRVSNLGRVAVTLEATCGPPFRIWNRNTGKLVGPNDSLECFDPAEAPITLHVGETVTFLSQWMGEDLDGVQLPVGTYGLEAWTKRADRANTLTTSPLWVHLEEDGYQPCFDPAPLCPQVATGPGPGEDVRPDPRNGFRPSR